MNNNYVLLVHPTNTMASVSLPPWTEIDLETGEISNSSGGIFQRRDSPRPGFWDGPPPPWCSRIERYTGNGPHLKQHKEVLWARSA